MSESIMSQAVAAERAWRWAEQAEQSIVGRASVAEAALLAQTWAAVAGQFEYVAYAASSEQRWAVAGEPLPDADAPTETLRVPLDLLGPAPDETAVIEAVCTCRHPGDPHPIGGFGCIHARRPEADYRPYPGAGS